MKKLLLASLLILGIQAIIVTANAVDVKVLTVTNNDDNGFYDLYIDVNEFNEAQNLKMYDRSAKDWTTWTPDKLAAGLILKESGSHKVIILKSKDFEKDRGGNCVMDYLYNGITGKRKSMDVEIDFNGTTWGVFLDGKKVELLDFRVKKVFGKVVGIDHVIAK